LDASQFVRIVKSSLAAYRSSFPDNLAAFIKTDARLAVRSHNSFELYRICARILARLFLRRGDQIKHIADLLPMPRLPIFAISHYADRLRKLTISHASVGDFERPEDSNGGARVF
jgi:hypothetical protein